MVFAVVSGFILQDLIADMQWEQIKKNIEGNTQISDAQKDEILSSQYDRVYSNSGGSAIFTYISMAISWPMRIAFWSLFAMLTANLFLGGGGKFSQIVTVSAFAYMPSIIEYIIKTPIQYLSDNMMIFTGLGALGIGEQGDFINSFLAGLDIFAFWRVFLMAVGISILYNKTTKTALTVMTGLWIFSLIVFAGMGAAVSGMFG